MRRPRRRPAPGPHSVPLRKGPGGDCCRPAGPGLPAPAAGPPGPGRAGSRDTRPLPARPARRRTHRPRVGVRARGGVGAAARSAETARRVAGPGVRRAPPPACRPRPRRQTQGRSRQCSARAGGGDARRCGRWGPPATAEAGVLHPGVSAAQPGLTPSGGRGAGLGAVEAAARPAGPPPAPGPLSPQRRDTRRLAGPAEQMLAWWGRVWGCGQTQECGCSRCSMEDSLEWRPGVPARDSPVWKALVLGGVERGGVDRAEPSDLLGWETRGGSKEGEGTPNPPGSFPDPGRVGQILQSFGSSPWIVVPSSLPMVHGLASSSPLPGRRQGGVG